MTNRIKYGDFILRPLTLTDNADIAAVIRQVSAEYGLTPDKGYGVSDLTLDNMYEVYSKPGAGYWVIEHDGKIVGGGGFAPLKGNEDICELQKMYFLPVIWKQQSVSKKLSGFIKN